MFNERAVKEMTSSLSSTQIGLHEHAGARLQTLRRTAESKYHNAAQESMHHHCTGVNMVGPGDAEVPYPHTFNKLLRMDARNNVVPPSRGSATPETRYGTPNLQGRTYAIDTRHGGAEGGQRRAGSPHMRLIQKPLMSTAYTSTFNSSYRPRIREHVAHGYDPKEMGDAKDRAQTVSMYFKPYNKGR